MALGKKTIEINTENPIKVQEEIAEQDKETKKRMLEIFAKVAVDIVRVVLGK